LNLANSNFEVFLFAEIKEQQRAAEESTPELEPEPVDQGKLETDLAMAAERTQRAKAKWDKIQRREVRRAEKAARRTSTAVTNQVRHTVASCCTFPCLLIYECLR
jgi:hypothetical protein